MRLNIVDKAVIWQIKGWHTLPHIILNLLSLEIPDEVHFKQMGGV